MARATPESLMGVVPRPGIARVPQGRAALTPAELLWGRAQLWRQGWAGREGRQRCRGQLAPSEQPRECWCVPPLGNLIGEGGKAELRDARRFEDAGHPPRHDDTSAADDGGAICYRSHAGFDQSRSPIDESALH